MTSVLKEDKEFLILQRKKGRCGSMAGVDKTLAIKEEKKSERNKKFLARQQQMKNMMLVADSEVALLSSTDESEKSSEERDEEKLETVDKTVDVGKVKKRKRGRKNIITPQLAAALDRTKVSDRKAVFIVSEAAKSLGQNIDEFALNKDSIRRQRMEERAKKHEKIKTKFQGKNPFVIQWDGKLMQDLTGKDKVDRLPILVSWKGDSQLLAVAKIPSATGEAQAAAIFEAIEDWGIVDNIRAMCFDTTSSNTGHNSGACILLEKKLKKELLSLACRHHIMELIISSVFEVCMGVSSSSPEVRLFKRFQGYWGFIDTNKYEPGISFDVVEDLVKDIKQETIDYAKKCLEQKTPKLRGDYKEFLELVVIFLGAVPARGVRFMTPGAMHHARWMSKVIYSLKIWMFKAQFKLTSKEEKGLRDVCVFTVRVYLKAWISAPQASCAPYNDLLLMKSLLEYSSVHSDISKSTSHKFGNHLWYLSHELVSLAFFDSRVSVSTKRLMVNAMQTQVHAETEDQNNLKRIRIALHSFTNKNLEDFVTAKSRGLFEKLELPVGYLSVDPGLWELREDYQQAKEIINSLQVVNDNAERSVALIQEYNGLITHDEMQLQFLLQVVEDHRKMYPDSRKITLSQPMQIP